MEFLAGFLGRCEESRAMQVHTDIQLTVHKLCAAGLGTARITQANVMRTVSILLFSIALRVRFSATVACELGRCCFCSFGARLAEKQASFVISTAIRGSP